MKNKILLGITAITPLSFPVMSSSVINQSTTLETSNLSSGTYFYKIMSNAKIVQSGKLISQQ